MLRRTSRMMRLGVNLVASSFSLPKDEHLAYCYKVLPQVSRSFAMVIQLLEGDLRDAMCVFYLVLRVLDTVEDDMSVPVEVKNAILESFHLELGNPSWHFMCGNKEVERDLVKNFCHISLAYSQLPQAYREVICSITAQMGKGMAEFTRKEVRTVADYDKYCYYVAGLVGVGSTSIFNKSGRETLDETLIQNPDTGAEALCISMGRCLQKVNVMKDYLEDVNEIPAPRMFWPIEIWGNYAPVLQSFKEPENETQAVQCLNHMITDWLRHVPDCLHYMAQLRDPSVFRFCAVPQTMAVATAALCYNNPDVFKGPVKIGRVATCLIASETQSMDDVCRAFHDSTSVLASKVNMQDPSAALTMESVQAVHEACQQYGDGNQRKLSRPHDTSSRKYIKLVLIILLALFVLKCFDCLSKSK